MRIGLGTFGTSATLLIAIVAATPSQAYTADQQQLCTNDALRLCGQAIPDVDRVTACMIQNRALLSPGCAQFFRNPEVQDEPLRTRKATKPRAAKKKRSR